jgi:ribonuclease P protein component
VPRRGRRRRTPRLDISWCDNELGHPRFGLVVPRHGQTAVSRNGVRRRVSEIMRRVILPGLGPIDAVIRVRPPAYGATFQELSLDLESWVRSLSA